MRKRKKARDQAADIVSRLSYKPLWWFTIEAHERPITLVARWLVPSSHKEFRAATALAALEKALVGEITPCGWRRDGALRCEDIDPAVVEEIERAWTLFDARLDIYTFDVTEAKMIQAVKHVIACMEEHERDEFLRLDGTQVVPTHPDGGRSFTIPDLVFSDGSKAS